MLNQDTINEINNLVFSSLAKGNKVFIEGIGTLSPKIIMATVSPKKPPIAKKIITLFRDCCGDDLHLLIGSLDGITKENIDYIYSQWLSAICISAGPLLKEYDIKSVIYIKLDTVKGTVTITASKLLDKALNPFNTEESIKEAKEAEQEIKVKEIASKVNDDSKKKLRLSLPIIITLFFVFAIAVTLILTDTISLSSFEKKDPSLITKEAPSNKTTPIIKEVPVEKPEPIITEIEKPIATPPVEESSSQKEMSAPQGRYYLIIGSFLAEENTIELVLTLKNKGYNPYTMPSPNGKMTMVSIMDFSTEKEAVTRRDNNDFNYDCWVYHKTK